MHFGRIAALRAAHDHDVMSGDELSAPETKPSLLQ
jgi:hypothetical protein